MPRVKYQVTPTPEGDWRVKRTGAERADSIHQNKEGAVDRARELAKKAELGQVVVHKKNGRIQNEYTYDKDPKLARSFQNRVVVSKKSQHVAPNLTGRWSVKSRGASRANKSFDKQVDAISWARSKSEKEGLVLVVHRRDGTVRSTASFQRDPSPPGQRNGRK